MQFPMTNQIRNSCPLRSLFKNFLDIQDESTTDAASSLATQSTEKRSSNFPECRGTQQNTSGEIATNSCEQTEQLLAIYRKNKYWALSSQSLHLQCSSQWQIKYGICALSNLLLKNFVETRDESTMDVVSSLATQSAGKRSSNAAKNTRNFPECRSTQQNTSGEIATDSRE